MLPGERKSVEPMGAKTAPAWTAAQHQSLLCRCRVLVGREGLAKVREMVLPAIERQGRSRRGSSTARLNGMVFDLI